MPLQRPMVEPIVAIEVLPELHIPPILKSLNKELLPIQTLRVPDIGSGRGLTVTVIVV